MVGVQTAPETCMGGTASHGHSREEGEGNRKEGIQLRECAYGQTHPSEDCKEEQRAEFNTS